MKSDINYLKRMAQLRYRDEILLLNKQGKSIRKITQIINYKLARTKFKVSLSRDTIHKIIKGKFNG